MTILVTSASGANGNGYGSLLTFGPDDIVPFPRGFAFGADGQLYFASGTSPAGAGDNTVLVFDAAGGLRTPHLVSDPELSPLDLAIGPNGNVLVSSEWPFGDRDAMTSVREYDPTTGRLVRVFAPDDSAGYRRPRGLRFGPGNRLYCTAEGGVAAFDFGSGGFAGSVVQFPRLNGQALVLLP